ncbi:MAG: ABC transporter ATP-binding protein [Chitinophagaceae bacterium]|nr:ABC transporter ATP-binding protein [Chitinophagaceae bacterium]
MENAITVTGLSKKYQLGRKRSGSFRETMSERFSGLFTKESNEAGLAAEFWALKEVSFEVKPGEVVGIIGKNGAGKSTLLKILSRITAPTKGRVEITGRVSSLLEVGTGFHPELTGRENIYMNGAILGMKRNEIKSKFDEIVAFSGIGQFIDTPVKRYSSGMYVRLAFAVAAHLEPEILIIDEVLAVGDAEFQKKCLGKMKDVSEQEGRTVLFVSHNMAAISSMCNTGLLLSKGEIEFKGNTQDMISRYLEQIIQMPSTSSTVKKSGLTFIRINTVNEIGEQRTQFGFSEPISVKMDFSNLTDKQAVNIGLAIRDATGKKLFTTVFLKEHLFKGDHFVQVRIPAKTLLQGHYTADIALFDNYEAYDYLEHRISLIITDADSSLRNYKAEEIGSIHIPCEWN